MIGIIANDDCRRKEYVLQPSTCVVSSPAHRKDTMAKGPPKAVLCIGSGAIELNLRCGLLQDCGWHVLSAGSGSEGVIRFSREKVDAVVIDLDNDGSEAALIAAELKRQRPEIPVVLLFSGEKMLAQGATGQADAVILKTNEALSLCRVLQNLVSKS